MKRALLAIAAVALAGCSPTGGTAPAPGPAAPSSQGPASGAEGTPDATPGQTTSPTPVALSSLDPGDPTAVGQFTWTRTNPSSEGGGTTRLTVSVGSVTSKPTGTRLTFWVNAPDAPDSLQVFQTKHPEDYPVLTDPRSKAVHRVSTWRSKANVYCICSEGSFVTASTVKPMDAAYAPLPADVTQVEVSIPGAKGSVMVPVTR